MAVGIKDILIPVDSVLMENAVTSHIGDTVSIRRPPRVLTDELGRNTWMGEVDPYELQLESVGHFNPYNSADAFSRMGSSPD